MVTGAFSMWKSQTTLVSENVVQCHKKVAFKLTGYV